METITTATANAVNPFAKAIRPKVREFAKKAGGLFQYARAMEHIFERVTAENSLGEYQRKTTFVNDFAIAECFGDSSILDTYRRALRDWLSSYEYATELAMSLNHLSWFWHYNGEPDLSRLYADLYYKARDAFYEYYSDKETDTDEQKEKKGAARGYFFRCID